jgi:peptidoglycan/xylan/chitin deacetylase (PgdA/CDA1 family)
MSIGPKGGAVHKFMLFFALALVPAVSTPIVAQAVAQGKPHTQSCVAVKVGTYQAQNIKVVGTTCSVVRARLGGWVAKGTKSFPHNAKAWHATRVRGSLWRVAYGRKNTPVVTFNLVVLPPPKATPTAPPPTTTTTPPATTTPPPARDVTPPTITITSPTTGEEYVWGQAAIAQYSCADDVAVASCTATVDGSGVANGGPLPTSGPAGPGTWTITVTAVDTSGNIASKSVNYVVNDKTPPTITITSPLANTSYTWAQTGPSVTAQFTCADNVAVKSCTAAVGTTAVSAGGALPTTGAPGPGTRTLTVTAVDTSGNTTVTSVNYVVQTAGYYAIELHDGPDITYTSQALTALASVNAKANFFFVGTQVDSFPSLAQQVAAAGMLIGNHTLNHLNICADGNCGDTVNPQPVLPDTPQAEVVGGATAITSITGVTPSLFMPPYGDYDVVTQADISTWTMSTALPAGETLCAWTVDSTDSNTPLPSTNTIVTNAETVAAGGMIEMHDDNANTVAAIPRIVTDLRNNKGLEPGMMYANPAISMPGPWDPLPAFHCGVEAFPGS